MGNFEAFEALLEIYRTTLWELGAMECCIYPLNQLDSLSEGPCAVRRLWEAAGLSAAFEASGRKGEVAAGRCRR